MFSLKYKYGYLLIFVLFVLVPVDLFATQVIATKDPTIYDNILDAFKVSANQWAPIFEKLGLYCVYEIGSF